MWMMPRDYPEESRILDTRFEDMTGLSMEWAEALQIQNYGIGGHYYSHYDTLKAGKNMDISGNHRIATLMLYVTTS
jgi:prolyl 4-hydroxylase